MRWNPDTLAGWARPCPHFRFEDRKASVEAAKLGLDMAMCRRSSHSGPGQLPCDEAESLQRRWQFRVNLWHRKSFAEQAAFLDYR